MDLPKVSRKISLFSILLFLLILITVNILLTAWIILTLRINFQGQQNKEIENMPVEVFLTDPL